MLNDGELTSRGLADRRRRLAHLLHDARTARSRRADSRDRDPDRGGSRRLARAAEPLEEIIGGALPAVVDVQRLLPYLASGMQRAFAGVPEIWTSGDDIVLPRGLMQALAAVVCELEHCSRTDGGEEERRLLLAIGEDGDDVVLAMVASGTAEFGMSLDRSASFARATEIIHALGGDIVRGLKDGQLLIGITLDPAVAGAVARGFQVSGRGRGGGDRHAT